MATRIIARLLSVLICTTALLGASHIYARERSIDELFMPTPTNGYAAIRISPPPRATSAAKSRIGWNDS